MVTAAIESRRRQDSRFLCFERDERMRQALELRYQSAIFCKDAFDLRLAAENEHLSGLDCVVSSLPFFNFSSKDRHFLLHEIHGLLNPGGIFVAFQYTRQLRPLLISIYDEMDTAYILANIPPAFLYICRKRG